MGARAGKLIPILLAPGILTNEADRDAANRYKDCDRVRFSNSLPETMGGSERVALRDSAGELALYQGVCRSLHDWASLNRIRWVGLGTHKKLYLASQLRLYDITPVRRTITVTNPFTTTNGFATVTVTDAGHRAEIGQFIRFLDATAVGGLTINGEYTVTTVLTPSTYQITAASSATSSATGGGSVQIEYDITAGLESNGELLGYGTGLYGEGSYGTPRAAGMGIQSKLRTWSLDNWGEDLMSNPSGGGIYWWDRSGGPLARAQLIANAPASVRRIIVNPENGFLIALGASDTQGNPDPMRVAWCEQGDFNTWLTISNVTDFTIASAGGKRLDYGSELVTGIKTRSAIVIWSDTQLYWMEFLAGSEEVFGFRPLGACKIVGPNAAVDVNGVVYFFAFDDFMIYDGTLRVVPCDVWSRVFESEDDSHFDKSQAEKVYCGSNLAQSEVWWFYPTVAGDMRYVVYNYSEQVWYFGAWERTAFHDVTSAFAGSVKNPYAANDGKLYIHEEGTDEVDIGDVTVPPWFLETWDITPGGSNEHMLVNNYAPNFDRITGFVDLIMKAKSYPQAPAYRQKGPYVLSQFVQNKGVRIAGSQIALRWRSRGARGESWRLGNQQWNPVPHGRQRGRTLNTQLQAPVLVGIYFPPESPPVET